MNFIIEIVTVIVITIVIKWLIWRKKRLSVFKKLGIPGPEPNFWSGNLGEINKEENLEQCLIDKYGKIVGFYLGARPMLFVADPELLKIIQVKEFKNFVNKDLLFSDMGVPHKSLTKSVEVSQDEVWRNLRYCLNAAFTTGKMKNMMKNINEGVDEFMKKVDKSNGQPLDAIDISRRLTFDITCRTSFELSTNIQNDEKNIFTESLQHIFRFDSCKILYSLTMCFPEFEPVLTRMRWMVDYVRYFLNFPSAGIIVKTCKGIIESKKKSEQNHSRSLLQLMINASKAMNNKTNIILLLYENNTKSKSITLSEEVILGNTVIFMAGGYETIGSALSHCIYLLAKNTEIQEKLRAEVNKHLYEKEDIDYSDISNLEYLDQVIAEVVRLYPVYFPAITRVCKQEFRYNDITIPKDAIVTVPLWYLHRNPEYWTSPEKFVPERFSNENRTKINPFVYQPFGAGPRNCIGMRLAQITIKATIVHLLKSYRLEKADEDEEVELNFDIFFPHPKKPLLFQAIPL